MNSNKVIIILLVILCSIFAYQTFFQKTNTNIEKAYATDSSSNTEILVVPFNVNSSEQKLAVFKKEDVRYKGNKLPNQWCMAVYDMRDGRKLKLEASRWIENDFFLKDFNIEERHKSVLHPESLREMKVKGDEFDPNDDKKEEPKKDETKNPDIDAPDWFLNPSTHSDRTIYVQNVLVMNKPEELLDAKINNSSAAKREVMKSVNSVVIKTLGSYRDKIQDSELKEKYYNFIYYFSKTAFDINSLSTFSRRNHLIQKDGKFILFSQISVDFKTITDVFSDEAMKEFLAICPEAKEAFVDAKKQVVAMTEKAFYTESAKTYLPE
ncbi:MAG: hypothetical protein K8S87_03700 [Planctomycetes bacterium]|nr:hypothetical protein [Planctomycetota bacterium]